MSFEVHHGDALGVLRTLETSSADAMVTDPPAGIAFMGATWDDPSKYGFSDGADRVGAPPTVNLGRNATCQKCGGRHRAGPKTKRCTCEAPAFNDKALRLRDRTAFIAKMTPIFEEACRVLKPGAHALVWALPRTSHWTATALEDAGFEIRDVGVHIFGSGFPKSLNVSKAIDKAAGATREVVGSKRLGGNAAVATKDKGGTYGVQVGTAPAIDVPITAPSTDAAKQWDGWGTALKPASEHWILARVPMRGTVVANVVGHGTGALNIDACRIATDWNEPDRPASWKASGHTAKPDAEKIAAPPGNGIECHPGGRWPANVTLDEETAAMLDAQSGTLGQARSEVWQAARGGNGGGYNFDDGNGAPCGRLYDGAGGASRFFYCAKASTSERTENVDSNKHPTVKPVELMRWLVRLITPNGSLVLDPFAGSGTTGVAALMEGMRFIGIERDADFVALARARISNALGPLFAPAMGDVR